MLFLAGPKDTSGYAAVDIIEQCIYILTDSRAHKLCKRHMTIVSLLLPLAEVSVHSERELSIPESAGAPKSIHNV